MMAAAISKSQAESVAAAARAVAARKKPEKRARSSKNEAELSPIVEPTEAQRAGAKFELLDIVDKRVGGTSVTIGKAYRRRPMIEILGEQGTITGAELNALRHYRHHADIADRSYTRDSLDRQRFGGSGVGPTVELLNAMQVRDDCERAAGVLVDILRAVVVYDMSLGQWAINQAGGVDKRYTRKGKGGVPRIINEIRPKENALKLAVLDIRMAAKRVQAELDA